jgi:glycosyltransferase involved in cell wall biosynthesis
MQRRKVLIIGMFDSIHLARWLFQFENQQIDFVLFPSKKFKYISFELLKLTTSTKTATYRFAKPYFTFKHIGFFDHFFGLILKRIGMNLKLIFLKSVIQRNTFNFIHAVEIQGAAYLYDSLPKHIQKRTTLIITNYGSDIQYFQNIPDHQEKIRSVLSKADFYSAECQRDYELALKFGFTGEFFPCIPNAGGFHNDVFVKNIVPSNDRYLIVAKCYGGTFGLGGLIIDALEIFLRVNPEVRIVIHSVTDDLREKSKNLLIAFPNRVVIYTVQEKIQRDKIIDYLSKARVYIGASRSDGISTSFLEALCLGAYPIQTDTSCASEWIDMGFFGSIIPPDSAEILNALNLSYFDKELDGKRIQNLENAKLHLSYDSVKSQSFKFYETRA